MGLGVCSKDPGRRGKRVVTTQKGMARVGRDTGHRTQAGCSRLERVKEICWAGSWQKLEISDWVGRLDVDVVQD